MVEKIAIREMENLETTTEVTNGPITPIIAPCWEVLALLGIIGLIGSVPSIFTALVFFVQRLRSR